MPTPNPKTAILLIDCPDRKGIVVTIVNFLVQQYDVNILNADQHQDVELGLFFMRVEFATDAPGFDEPAFRAAFAPIAQEFRMNWRIEFADVAQNVALFVSQYPHCLADLLHRHQAGEFRANLAMMKLGASLTVGFRVSLDGVDRLFLRRRPSRLTQFCVRDA